MFLKLNMQMCHIEIFSLLKILIYVKGVRLTKKFENPCPIVRYALSKYPHLRSWPLEARARDRKKVRKTVPGVKNGKAQCP